ncbi:hypothetical protein A2Z33_01705 [Candidatus Gottesmanbacteria bacterium RBG_16_52_11]|uniref:Uncharacterized protein n=1 Tax=Candidatus Gottesmanbacteria bacterium RBG_16_52_11 TaxID=1798374 RepID=A0A1F5YPE7_9BACT|nr:MAG: hypothetical protein A2Z33_01705 [Candidatus Gottesmanbacteria bacterium RBG_16_52_11]
MIVGILITSNIINQKNFDLRTKASQQYAGHSLIFKLTINPTTGVVSVKNATALKGGFVPSGISDEISKDMKRVLAPNITDEFELVELNGDDEVRTKKIQFTEYLFGAPPLPGKLTGDPLYKLSEPEAVVHVKYDPGSTFVIRNTTTDKTTEVPVDLVGKAMLSVKEVTANVNTKTVHDQSGSAGDNVKGTTTEGDGYVDVLFMSSAYTDFNLFTSDVTAMSNFLFTVAPYSERSNKFRLTQLNNSENLGCYYSGNCIICDGEKVLQIAAQTNYDYITVVHNNNTYGGCAGSIVATVYRNVYQWAKHVMVHELSHTFGQLRDEYNFGYESPIPPTGPNCDVAGCPKWAGVPGTVCHQICGYTNHYRSSDYCLMYTLQAPGGYRYDPVCYAYVNSRIDAFSNSGPTPTPTGVPISCRSNIDIRINNQANSYPATTDQTASTTVNIYSYVTGANRVRFKNQPDVNVLCANTDMSTEPWLTYSGATPWIKYNWGLVSGNTGWRKVCVQFRNTQTLKSKKCGDLIYYNQVYPTPTGRKTPTPSVRRTPTPIRTPTRTPTPQPGNTNPVIQTRFLSDATLNQQYTNFIYGWDGNANETLTMTITGLPPGIVRTTCNLRHNFGGYPSYLECYIEGKPTQRGTFNVVATIYDGRGGSGTKTLPLIVN